MREKRQAENLFPEVKIRLAHLAEPLAEPQDGDWLAEHPEEGQTFEQYLAAVPVRRDRRLDTFRVLGSREVAYLDLVGSGIETVAHLRENGRITIMFCAFGGPPRILRLYGKGQTVEPGDDGWDPLAGLFPDYPDVRSVVLVDLDRIADSCGYGVPLFDFAGQLKQLHAYAERKGPQGMEAYKRQKNLTSIDGLPGRGHRHPVGCHPVSLAGEVSGRLSTSINSRFPPHLEPHPVEQRLRARRCVEAGLLESRAHRRCPPFVKPRPEADWLVPLLTSADRSARPRLPCAASRHRPGK